MHELTFRHIRFVLVCTVCMLLVSALAVQAAPSKLDLPFRHIGTLDGPVVQVSDNDGRTFAVWSYRNGAEFDIAVSRQDGNGFWSAPRFFGLDDGLDQVRPAVAVDGDGNIYLAFEIQNSGRILMKVLPASSDTWSYTVSLTGVSRHGTAPALQVVRDRLVVAYQSDGETVIVARPIYRESPHLQGLQDDPDPATDYRDPGDGSEDDEPPVGGDTVPRVGARTNDAAPNDN